MNETNNQLNTGAFLAALHQSDEDLKFVALKIRDILLSEIKEKGLVPDIIEPVQHLVRMGFKNEANTAIGDILVSSHSFSHMGCYELCNLLNLIVMEHQSEHLPRTRNPIYLEEYIIENDLVKVVYCDRDRRNEDDETKWVEGVFHIKSLKAFYEKYHATGTSDTVDHSGNHVQDEWHTPFERLDGADIEKEIIDYINSGWEVVVTN